MPKENAVLVSNLSYKYPATKTWVLKNINLQIPKQSFYVIAGPSGSGKSTLLSLIRGYHQEFGGKIKGEIVVDSVNVNTTPITELGKSIGIVFQNPALQLHQLRVIDEVASAPMYQGLPHDECVKKAKELANKFLGKEFYNLHPSELSSGQQQKVALAASLSLDPDLLILDEPFSFLDERSDQELIKVLVELNKKGKTIVVATHDVGQLASTVTHMGLIDNGDQVMHGSARKVLYSKTYSEIMPPPLFVQAATATKLTNQPLTWSDTLPFVSVDRPKKQITNNKKEPVLHLEKISYKYPGSKKGIIDISFNTLPGEVLSIIGPNGSGKTTLAKVILGLLKPQKGKVMSNGENITDLPTEKRAKNIGYVTQDPLDMFFEMNLLDEVAAGPKFLDIPNPKVRAEKTLKQFKLWIYRKKHPDSISGGEKSRLGIADIAVNDTNILILDEPEFGLDPKSWNGIVKYLEKLKSLGKSIVIITQDLEAAFFISDRVVVLKDGKIVKTGSSVEIFKNDSLLNKVGLNPLPFSPLIEKFSDKIDLSGGEFIKCLKKK